MWSEAKSFSGFIPAPSPGSEAEVFSTVALSLGWMVVNAQSEYPCWVVEEK